MPDGDYDELKAAVLEFLVAFDQHPPNYKLRRRRLDLLRHIVGAPPDPVVTKPTGSRARS
jgi:hypothetical protein